MSKTYKVINKITKDSNLFKLQVTIPKDKETVTQVKVEAYVYPMISGKYEYDSYEIFWNSISCQKWLYADQNVEKVEDFCRRAIVNYCDKNHIIYHIEDIFIND